MKTVRVTVSMVFQVTMLVANVQLGYVNGVARVRNDHDPATTRFEIDTLIIYSSLFATRVEETARQINKQKRKGDLTELN